MEVKSVGETDLALECVEDTSIGDFLIMLTTEAPGAMVEMELDSLCCVSK